MRDLIKKIRLVYETVGKEQEREDRIHHLEAHVRRLYELLHRVVFQYRGFRLITPTTIKEIELECGGIDDEIRNVLQGEINLNEMDVVPRSEYVALTEAYGRLATQLSDFFEKQRVLKEERRKKREAAKKEDV